MRSFDPQYADRVFDPRTLVATIGTEADARAASYAQAREWAEDSANFRHFNREMRGNRGVL